MTLCLVNGAEQYIVGTRGSLKFGKNVTVFSLLLYFLIESDFYFASLETFLKKAVAFFFKKYTLYP